MNGEALLASIPTTLDSTFVFHERQLRDGINLRETARFRDDHWPLTPVSLQGQQQGLTLRFDTVPERHRYALKLFFYRALSGELPLNEERPTTNSIATYFYNLRLFATWLEEEEGGCRFSQVDAAVYERYQRHLLRTHGSQARRYALRSAVMALWRYRDVMRPHGLSIDPRSVTEWTEKQVATSGENSTPRIPEEVHSRLLVWALRFVHDFSEDILSAVGRFNQLKARKHKAELVENLHGQSVDVRISAYLSDVLKTGRPLPGSDGKPSFNAIARATGCNLPVLASRRPAILSVAKTVGVSEYAYLGIEMLHQLDDKPWLAGVHYDPIKDDSITVLTQMLQAAAYIVVAFLSGMRDSEVKHLRAGCSSRELDGNGRAYRWKVDSLAFKGEEDHAGVPATWVVGESAAKAIEVLERLHRDRTNGRTDWLFAPLKVGTSVGSFRRSGENEAMTLAGTNRQLNRFVTWVNSYCATRGRSDGIPDVDGEVWRVSTRQFRRTLAWYIARRPGGVIAGAMQFRHHSIQMFEGYAGTSESGFRAEVEAEEALARGEYLLAMIDRHEHEELSGPASDEAERRLNDLGERASFIGNVTTDKRRLLRLMSRNDPAVYPGKYVTCVYNHGKALCSTHAGVEPETPDLTDCKPLTCRNVAMDTANVAAWREELKVIETELTAGHLLPPLLLDRLEKRREQILQFLTRHGAQP